MSSKEKNPYSFDANLLKKIWQILPKKRKHSAIIIAVLMVIGMAFEMLSVGLVIPIISLLLQNDTDIKYHYFNNLLNIFGKQEPSVLLGVSIMIMVVLFLLKNLYLAFSLWIQTKFAYGLQFDLSQNLFSSYMQKPYKFYLQRNSAHLIRNVQNETELFIMFAINPGLIILSEGLVVSGLAALLIFIEPVGTITIFGVMALAGVIFSLLTRKSIIEWSKKNHNIERLRLKHLHQAFGSFKDMKLLGREKNLIFQYALHTKESMEVLKKYFFVQQTPRLWLEFLAVVGLAILIIFMLAQQKPIDDVIPILALFAAITLRLMPSVGRIISMLEQMKFSSTPINVLHDELYRTPKDKGDFNNENNNFQPLTDKIEVKEISFSHEENEENLLSSVSLAIRKGEMVGFIGESGSGKSTLIDIVLGLLPPSKGAVFVDGNDISLNLRGWQNQIGYVPQTIYLTDDTIARNIALGLEDKDIDISIVMRVIREAQLEKFIGNLSDGIHTTVGERGIRLSGGQRQRIGIARALYHDPSILILDEATSALDVETETAVMREIAFLHKKKTILIVAHRLSTVEKCDRIYRVCNGEVLECNS